MADEIRYYKITAGNVVARKLAAEIQVAIDHLQRNPGTGSPRWSEFLDIPGLRSWQLKNFPLLFFYIERDDSLDVVRLLGERQNISALLGLG